METVNGVLAISDMTFGWLLTIVGLTLTMGSLSVLILMCTILKKFQKN